MTLLADALELLRRDGWYQGEYANPVTGARCSLGALRELTFARGPLLAALAETIQEQYPDEVPGLLRELVANGRYASVEEVVESHGSGYLNASLVTTWNDVEGRSFHEVEAVFEKADLKLQEREAETDVHDA